MADKSYQLIRRAVFPIVVTCGVGLGYFAVTPYSVRWHIGACVAVFVLTLLIVTFAEYLETGLAEAYGASWMRPTLRKTLMSDEELIEQTNNLAHRFYRMHGYQAPKGFKFYEATHPQEVLMWDMACAAMEDLRQTDVSDLV